MATVGELRHGEQLVLDGPFGTITSTFVAETQHPIWPNLRLVIWRMGDGSWSHDALDFAQDVGTPEPSTPDERQTNLRRALLALPDDEPGRCPEARTDTWRCTLPAGHAARLHVFGLVPGNEQESP